MLQNLSPQQKTQPQNLFLGELDLRQWCWEWFKKADNEMWFGSYITLRPAGGQKAIVRARWSIAVVPTLSSHEQGQPNGRREGTLKYLRVCEILRKTVRTMKLNGCCWMLTHALDKDNERVWMMYHQFKRYCECQWSFLGTYKETLISYDQGQKNQGSRLSHNSKDSRTPKKVEFSTSESLLCQG